MTMRLIPGTKSKPSKPGPKPSCQCGKCPKCRHNASQRAYFARKRDGLEYGGEPLPHETRKILDSLGK